MGKADLITGQIATTGLVILIMLITIARKSLQPEYAASGYCRVITKMMTRMNLRDSSQRQNVDIRLLPPTPPGSTSHFMEKNFVVFLHANTRALYLRVYHMPRCRISRILQQKSRQFRKELLNHQGAWNPTAKVTSVLAAGYSLSTCSVWHERINCPLHPICPACAGHLRWIWPVQ